MEYTAGQIAKITGGRLISGREDILLRHVSFDSRAMLGEDLFVPTIGEKTDGHRFIRSAFANGALASLTSRDDVLPAEAENDGRAYILVEDTVAALQRLGRRHREQALKMPIVGVTGSVGKTTTREMTMAALSAGGSVTGSIKNMNSQLGVPVTLCHMDETADFAVVEMGISEPGEMERLADMVRPDIALVTNIGVAHIENLGSREGICREKMKITDHLPEDGCAILNGDEPLLLACRESRRFRTLYYGLGPEAAVTAKDIALGETASFTAVLPASLRSGAGEIAVAVVRLGHISNFTDFIALDAIDGVGVRYVQRASEMGEPDLIVLPGTKNTLADLKWLRESGIETVLLKRAAAGTPVFGICGGFQMLGWQVSDPHGMEGGGTLRGLGLLPLQTVFAPEKHQVRVVKTLDRVEGVLAALSGVEVEGYEIHLGETSFVQSSSANALDAELFIDASNASPSGAASPVPALVGCGNVYGTYIHGFFDRQECAQAVVSSLLRAKGLAPSAVHALDMGAYKQQQYDKLADAVRAGLDMSLIYQILQEGA